MSRSTPNTAADLASQAASFLDRAEAVLDRLEAMLPAARPAEPDWNTAHAFRWRHDNRHGWLEPIHRPQQVDVDVLRGVETQRAAIERNTARFVSGHPANNVLLTGARGTGKSSLIKAMLTRYASAGLRMIEVDKQNLVDLPDITELIASRPERFIVFCDDLGFDANDSGYMALKTALDGSLAAPPDNLLIYATSNRRHLIPENQRDNLPDQPADLHPGETVDEKISLSDRFGLWLSFYAFDQDTYLACVDTWLRQAGLPDTSDLLVRREALLWALARGNRSGRSARQFAQDFGSR